MKQGLERGQEAKQWQFLKHSTPCFRLQLHLIEGFVKREIAKGGTDSISRRVSSTMFLNCSSQWDLFLVVCLCVGQPTLSSEI